VPALRVALAALWLFAAAVAHAGALRLCEREQALSTAQQDRRLRLAAQVRHELTAAGATVALIARSGVDLSRFGLRYSHSGLTLRDNPNTPWSVRQLYYDCQQARPRLFDQGLAGFVLAADDVPATAHVTLLLPPPEAAQALRTTALDPGVPLRLLAARYSANAYAFSLRYQNCNQWLAELLAVALGGLGPDASRADAQRWLQQAAYEPQAVRLPSPLWVPLAWLLPLLHVDDHPPADLEAPLMRISMPDSVLAFAQARLPAARRIELCHDARHIVVRRDGSPLGPGCDADRDGDEVTPLGDPAGIPADQGLKDGSG
jgi:hypothetical protein